MITNSVTMSWSKQRPFIGPVGANQAMCDADDLFSPGYVNDKSTTLSSEDGDTLTAKITGGATIAEEYGEPTLTVTYRVKEMDFETEKKIIGGTIDTTNGGYSLKSALAQGEFSLLIIPKNIGAIGIAARRTSVVLKPGFSEEEGHYVDVTHKILACADGTIYTKFRVTEEMLTWAKAHCNY